MNRGTWLIVAATVAILSGAVTQSSWATDLKQKGAAPKVAAPRPAPAPRPMMAAPKPAVPKVAAAPAKPAAGAPKPGVTKTTAQGAKSAAGAKKVEAKAAVEHPGEKVAGAKALGPKGAEERHAAGAHVAPRVLARDDPARRGGKFDEHHRDLDREREIGRRHEHDFHVRDARHFDAREWGEWRGGRWHRDWYNGRRGWYYDVGGVWYPYAEPIFPYPIVVAPLVVTDAAVVQADARAMADPPVAIAPLPALPTAAYYCERPAGFYPAVSDCEASWSSMNGH